jgi:hypothetical protein
VAGVEGNGPARNPIAVSAVDDERKAQFCPWSDDDVT